MTKGVDQCHFILCHFGILNFGIQLNYMSSLVSSSSGKETNLMDSGDKGCRPMDSRPSDAVEQGSVAEVDGNVALFHPGGHYHHESVNRDTVEQHSFAEID